MESRPGALVVDKEVSLDNWQNLALKNDLHLNDDLELEGSNDLMLNGIISGSKGIKKQGKASLTLKRDNSYQGGTTINEGNLILGNDTALGSGGVKLEKKVSLNSPIPLKLANTVWVNEDLQVEGDHDLTLDGVISGPGSLSKFGMNHLMLNAANNYSGGTFFDDGIILLGNDTALGSGTLTVRGMLNRLGTTTALTLNNPIELIGELVVDGHHDLTLNGAISGEEYLNKHGEATLRLNAANRHEGGVILSGGKLLLGNSAALGSGSLMLLEKGGSLETTTALELTIYKLIQNKEVENRVSTSHLYFLRRALA